MSRLTSLALAFGLIGAALPAAQAAPVEVLFVGNSYTFGRVDPVMSYNAANVTDLTDPSRGGNFTQTEGTNSWEPHPWGGVAGIFKQLTEQAGLDYKVSLSARNAASLRGHFLNTNGDAWDLRGNLALQTWDKVVLQEQSDNPFNLSHGLNSSPGYFQLYANLIENYLHVGVQPNYRERDFFPGNTNGQRNASCAAATGASTGSCGTERKDIPTNLHASDSTEVFLYETWARPNLVNGALATQTDDGTGAVTRTGGVITTDFLDLESQTAELAAGYLAAMDAAGLDGSGGITGVAPVGQAFLRAVQTGVATRDMYADDALTDGLIDLWFDDGTHASKFGSYLSALVLFGELTGLDPAQFGDDEIAAQDLGIDARSALLLQRVASDQLGFAAPVPTPASLPLAALALALLAVPALRRRGGAQ
jgi:hypothetical protein